VFLVIFLASTSSLPTSDTKNTTKHLTSGEDGNSSEKIIVLPHIITENVKPNTTVIENAVKRLHKKEGYAKGLLVNKDLGNKFLLLKPHKGNKVITLKHINAERKTSKQTDKLDRSSKPHSRKKRFIFGGLRNIAVPLTIFHYLGFMPMRVPGLPFHEDPGLPDYTVYEPYNDLSYPEEPVYSRSFLRRRKRKNKYY